MHYQSILSKFLNITCVLSPEWNHFMKLSICPKFCTQVTTIHCPKDWDFSFQYFFTSGTHFSLQDYPRVLKSQHTYIPIPTARVKAEFGSSEKMGNRLQIKAISTGFQFLSLLSAPWLYSSVLFRNGPNNSLRRLNQIFNIHKVFMVKRDYSDLQSHWSIGMR